MITPGQFEIPGQTPITDPLQLQFMTQGQMGYMPQAQFLTPYQYGNFRTMPTPDVMGYAAQETGFLQNMLIANRGADPFGVLPAYTFDTYNPAVNARQQQVYAQRRIEDSKAGLGAFGLELGANLGLTMFGGIPGMLMSMAMPDWLSPSEAIAQRRKSTREVQNLTTSKIFTGQDRDSSLGYGFGFQQARGLDRYIRESAADDSLMKEGDWRDMLSLGMKYGQFDYANNAEQYKRILKNMRGNMTTMMEVIGSTDFEEIMKNMKRMQDMGAQQEHYMSIARKEQQYARVTGLSHQQMVDTYGQSGALTFQQMGLNAMQGSVTAMGNAALATYLQRTGAIDPTLMAHFGGVSGMAQQMTQASAKAHRNIQDTLLAGMMNDDFTGLAEGLDLVDIVQDPAGMDKLLAGAGRVNTIGKQRRFNVNRHKAYADLQEKYGPEVVEALMAKMAGQRLTGGSGDDALFYGYQALGYSSEEAEARLAMVKSGGIWEMQKQAKEEQRRKAKEEREQRNSPLNKIGRWFEGMKNWMGERMYYGLTERGPVTTEQARDASNSGSAVNNNVATASGGGSRSRHSDEIPDYDVPDNVREQNPYFFSHMDDLDALSVEMETGGTKGMQSWTKDNYGYAFGKYQTNSDRGSQQEWMEYMWLNGDVEGKGVVTSLLRSGGITGEITDDNVLSLAKKVNWGDSNVLKTYEQQAKEHEQVMADTQFGLIKGRYDYALNEVIRKKNPELAALIDSDLALQQQLFSAVVQHGPGEKDGSNGAPYLFLSQYKSGMGVLDLVDAVQAERPKHFRKEKDRKDQATHRSPRETGALHASYNIRHGLPIKGVRGEASDKAKSASAGAIEAYGREAIDVRHVKYALGARDSYEGKGYKDWETGEVKATSGYYVDCSGAVIESYRKMAEAANEAEGYTVFSQETIDKIAKAATSEGIIDVSAKMNGGKIYYDDEITSDVIKQEGVMFFAMDAGEYNFDKDRDKGIDHITMAYWDDKTNQAVIMQSSSGKGINFVNFEEYMKENRNKGKTNKPGEKRRYYATSATGTGKYKPKQEPTATQGKYEGTSSGRKKGQRIADEEAGGTIADARMVEQLDKEEWVGGLGSNFAIARKDIYRMQNDIGIGELESEEEFNKQQDINAQFYNARMKEIAESFGADVSNFRDLSREELDLGVKNRHEEYMESTKNFAGIVDKGYIKRDILMEDPDVRAAYGTVDFDKLEAEHPEYQMNLENARKAGFTGEVAKRVALEMTLEKGTTTYQRAQAARTATEGRALEVKDISKKGFDRANSTTNTEDTLDMLKTYAQVGERMMGAGLYKEGRMLFDNEYRDIVMDNEVDTEGKATYTRGAYAEKIPEIANILGHLAAVEKEYNETKKKKNPPEGKLKALESRKSEIIDVLVDALGSYNIPAEKIREIVERHTTVGGRIDEISTAIKSYGGMEWNTKASTFAKDLTKKSEEYWSSEYEEGIIFGKYGSGEYNKKFNAAGAELKRLREDPNLRRMRSKDLTIYQIGTEFQDSGKMLRNLGGIDYAQIVNLKDQPKSVQEAMLKRLRAIGEEEVAKEIEETLKQGKNPDKETLEKLMYNKDGSARKAENALDATQRSMAVDNDRVKGEVTAGLGSPGKMGQQPGIEGNGNLDRTLGRLNDTMTRIDTTLDNINRKLLPPGQG